MYALWLGMRLDLSAVTISVRITPDDTIENRDRTVVPTYLPANDARHAGSPGEQCAMCTMKPSKLDKDETLHSVNRRLGYF